MARSLFHKLQCRPVQECFGNGGLVGRASKDMLRFQFDTFVLTHQDISPRNIILARDGQLWLIDWAHAGAYPPVFESAGLLAQHHFKVFSERVLSLITHFPKEEDKLDSITYGLTTAALALGGRLSGQSAN